MLPTRYALVLAAAISLVSGLVCLHGAGYDPALFTENLSVSLEKYGLYGYSVAARMAAARLWKARAEGGLAPAQRKAALDAAAGDLGEAARLLEAQGARTAAVAALERAVAIAPWRSQLRGRLLAARIAVGDRLALGQAFDLAFRRDDPEGLVLMAQVYLRSGRTDDALGCLRHAAKKAPHSFRVQLALAQYLGSLGAGAETEARLHARAAERAAANLGERLEALAVLRETGAQVPSRAAVLVAYYWTQCSTTLAVLTAYMLALTSPWWVGRAQVVGVRLRQWRAGIQAAQ